jgi:hypothetical protein
MFAAMFFALTYFLAEYGFGGKGPGGFGSISFYLMFAMLFPGFMPGEMLAQLRPRIATHLLRPLDRRQLVDGLLSATGWNVCAMWICMNVGLVLQAYYVVPDDQSTPELFGTMIFLSAAMTLAMAGVTMRIAVWPSQLKRMFAFWVTLILFMPTLVAWQIARDKYGDWPFVAAGLLLAAFGVWMITQARRAWMNLELG